MSDRNDLDYYARRARREREIADKAPDAAIAAAHLELAREYERRVESGRVLQPAGNS
jgi:hypothetical protein